MDDRCAMEERCAVGAFAELRRCLRIPDVTPDDFDVFDVLQGRDVDVWQDEAANPAIARPERRHLDHPVAQDMNESRPEPSGRAGHERERHCSCSAKWIALRRAIAMMLP
jgi:hypothetical protein